MPQVELLTLPQMITGENLHHFLGNDPNVEGFPLSPTLDLWEYAPLIKGVYAMLNLRFFDPKRVQLSRALYIDKDSGKIVPSSIAAGSLSSVTYNYREIFQRGDYCLIESYTKPEDGLPYAEDYLPLIQGVMKGILVLCPNFQLLALVTNQTSRIYDADEALAYLEKLDKNPFTVKGMSVARDLQVKLYSSTDMRHFLAFSA